MWKGHLTWTISLPIKQIYSGTIVANKRKTVNFTYHNFVCQKYKNYASWPLSHIYTQNLSKNFSTHFLHLVGQQSRSAHPIVTLVMVAVVVECH